MILYTKAHPGHLISPKFFNGVCQTLINLGFDIHWVEQDFKDSLSHHYVAQTMALCSNQTIDDTSLPFVIGAYFQR